MKEYTILSFISVGLTIGLNRFLKTNIFRQKEYYIFILSIFFFKLLVNGYLTKNIVIYNPDFFLGIRIGTIPLEDFIFGFSMVTMLIIFWEHFKKSSSR
ncbi:MAG: lycopene cyclase domain-containing protein [Candidatus Omnitrophica bacterium]|jgi:lycopene cyclase domain-containing protein|nr:lycopene cyclase domain-containing protein [Candidatus Omnitrophota bacterium]